MMSYYQRSNLVMSLEEQAEKIAKILYDKRYEEIRTEALRRKREEEECDRKREEEERDRQLHQNPHQKKKKVTSDDLRTQILRQMHEQSANKKKITSKDLSKSLTR